jgi:hypothetical protein
MRQQLTRRWSMRHIFIQHCLDKLRQISRVVRWDWLGYLLNNLEHKPK